MADNWGVHTPGRSGYSLYFYNDNISNDNVKYGCMILEKHDSEITRHTVWLLHMHIRNVDAETIYHTALMWKRWDNVTGVTYSDEPKDNNQGHNFTVLTLQLHDDKVII